jgi:hypothetical protein
MAGSPISKFYKSCFYSELFATAAQHGIKSRAGVMSKLLYLKGKKTKAFFKVFERLQELKSRYPFLCLSLRKCTLPSYLRFSKDKDKKTAYRCSKVRYCPYCWNRSICMAYRRMTSKIDKKSDKYKDYSFFYNEKVLYIPVGSSSKVIADKGLSMFSPRWTMRPRYLEPLLVAGVAEMLVVHSHVLDGNRVYKLTLKQVFYCHVDSKMAKDTICESKRFGKAAIKFCCFPVSMLYDGPLRSIKIDEAFRRRRLIRQYGLFYSADDA